MNSSFLPRQTFAVSIAVDISLQSSSNLFTSCYFFYLVPSQITNKTRWLTDGRTVAGGHGRGEALNQLHYPYGLDINNDGSLFVP